MKTVLRVSVVCELVETDRTGLGGDESEGRLKDSERIRCVVDARRMPPVICVISIVLSSMSIDSPPLSVELTVTSLVA